MKNNYYFEYWKSCIKHQNDFPELVFPVLGGGEVATSSKFRFGKPKLLFFKIEHFKLCELSNLLCVRVFKIPEFVCEFSKNERSDSNGHIWPHNCSQLPHPRTLLLWKLTETKKTQIVQQRRTMSCLFKFGFLPCFVEGHDELSK